MTDMVLRPGKILCGVALCAAVAVQPVPVAAVIVTVTPADELKFVPRFVEYVTLSAKYDSSAVTRLRRSDFIDAMYAFSFVFANFGIAMAARMPMMTTTISSSMRVKPLLVRTVRTSRWARLPHRRDASP